MRLRLISNKITSSAYSDISYIFSYDLIIFASIFPVIRLTKRGLSYKAHHNSYFQLYWKVVVFFSYTNLNFILISYTLYNHINVKGIQS